MIEKALRYLIGLAPGEQIKLDGRQYSTRELYPIKDPTAEFLELHSLTGLVDYLKFGYDLKILYPEVLNLEPGKFVQKEENDEDKVFIHVLGPGTVYLYGALDPKWHQRECFLKVSLIDNSFRFGQWHEIEDFIVELQAKFIVDDIVRDILAKITRIDQEASKAIEDNGISQSTIIRKGVTTVAKVNLPNPVDLRPYRTFAEIDQPTSKFVFRIKSFPQREGQELPRLALFDAGGNKWQMECILAIKQWLHEQLPDIAIIA